MNHDLLSLKEHLSDSSRNLANLTANMVYDNPSLLKQLLEISWLDEDPWCQRASRVVAICGEKFPELIWPYISKIINRLGKQNSESVRRNFLKLLQDNDFNLSEKDDSALLNLCFDYLTGPFSVAVKVYSMEILYRLSLKHPDIQRELYEIIDDQKEEASAGYKSRASKILKKISRGV